MHADNDGWFSVDDHPPPVRQFIQVYVDHTVNAQAKFIKETLNLPLQYVTVAQVMWYDTVYGENEVVEGEEPRWGLTIVGGGPMGNYENITHWKHLSDPPRK